MSPQAALLPGNRLHLQHGPIDLIIGANGARDLAFKAAITRFETVLQELVEELPLLRSALLPGTHRPSGQIARRMFAACQPHSAEFITPMAAVAGSVSDAVLAAMLKAASISRGYVNNGGDISVYMEKNQSFIAEMHDHSGRNLGRITLCYGEDIGGIATSGRHGRSHSLGIADSVTVLARTASEADVAATLLANSVDLPGHQGITRTPASTLDPDSDLGDMPVVTACTALAPRDIEKALNAGETRAKALQANGTIKAAALFLGGETRLLGKGFAPNNLIIERETR